jgi:hypothetical protein
MKRASCSDANHGWRAPPSPIGGSLLSGRSTVTANPDRLREDLIRCSGRAIAPARTQATSRRTIKRV